MKTLANREDLIFNPPQSGCVLYLAGLPGGGSSIHDRSPHGNHGTITGATWKRTAGGLWHLDFDGSDDYVSGSTSGFPLGAAIRTALVWIKITGASQQGGGNFFGYGSGAPQANFCLFESIVDANTSYLRFVSKSGDEDPQNPPNLNDGQWHLVGMTYDGSDLTGFVDGVANFTATRALNTITGTWKIGMSTWNSNDLAGCTALTRLIPLCYSEFQFKRIFDREKSLFGVW